MTKAAKAPPDWERIELDYRAGILSLREIAAKNPGISHVSIAKRAKKDGWTRDLNARIQAKADALVNRATVNGAVNGEQKALTEQQTVDVNATAIMQVRLGQRGDIARGRTLVMSLLGELEAQTGDPDLFEKLGELVSIDQTAPAEEGDVSAGEKRRAKLLDAYNKALNLGARIDNAKKLAEALKHLIGLEREVWGLEAPAQKLNVKVASDGEVLTDDEIIARLAEIRRRRGEAARGPAGEA